MNLYEAVHLARSLIQAHGLAGWSFGFDHARRRFGACHYGRRRITLSRPLVLLNGIAEVRDTVLHEIAHALCPGDNHGPRWRATCARIGARPKRCYDEADVVSPPRPPAPFLLGCVRCDWWAPRRRRVRAKYVCRTCRGRVVYRELAISRPRPLPHDSSARAAGGGS